MNRLEQICATKRREVTERSAIRTLQELDVLARAASAPRGFAAALSEKVEAGFGLIAEIKRASPSKGLIRQDFDPATHARDYAAGGAACLSVLTDASYFQGHEEFLVHAREAASLPVLRKDFMVDPWQIAESRALGADAVLLIVAALDNGQMAELESAALERGMDVLVEVHDATELERALRLHSRLIGVNNRDLRTFATDIGVTEELARLVPADVMLVSESGIASHADCQRLARHGVRRFLVGESLMRQADLSAATRSLLGNVPVHNGGNA